MNEIDYRISDMRLGEKLTNMTDMLESKGEMLKEMLESKLTDVLRQFDDPVGEAEDGDDAAVAGILQQRNWNPQNMSRDQTFKPIVHQSIV